MASEAILAAAFLAGFDRKTDLVAKDKAEEAIITVNLIEERNVD